METRQAKADELMNLYDRGGAPISFERWAALNGELSQCVLRRTLVGTVEVSTVWLGVFEDWCGDGPPLIFETMLICGDDRDGTQWRYPTHAEALAGHDRVVEMVRGR